MARWSRGGAWRANRWNPWRGSTGVLVLVSLSLTSTPGRAEVRDTAPDRFLRWGFGFGGANFSEAGVGLEVEAHGLAAALFCDFGGALAERLSLFGRVYGGGIDKPKLRVDGQETAADDLAINFVTFGSGLMLHLPAGFHVSGTVGFGTVQVFVDGQREYGESDLGFAYALDAGWQAYLTRRFALGGLVRYGNLIASDGPGADVSFSQWVIIPMGHVDW